LPRSEYRTGQNIQSESEYITLIQLKEFISNLKTWFICKLVNNAQKSSVTPSRSGTITPELMSAKRTPAAKRGSLVEAPKIGHLSGLIVFLLVSVLLDCLDVNVASQFQHCSVTN